MHDQMDIDMEQEEAEIEKRVHNLKTFLLAIVGVFLKTFVVLHYWNWFFAPTFGLAEINFWMSMGLILCVPVVYLRDTDDMTPEEEMKRIRFRILSMVFLFAFGSLIHLGV